MLLSCKYILTIPQSAALTAPFTQGRLSVLRLIVLFVCFMQGTHMYRGRRGGYYVKSNIVYILSARLFTPAFSGRYYLPCAVINNKQPEIKTKKTSMPQARSLF